MITTKKLKVNDSCAAADFNLHEFRVDLGTQAIRTVQLRFVAGSRNSVVPQN